MSVIPSLFALARRHLLICVASVGAFCGAEGVLRSEYEERDLIIARTAAAKVDSGGDTREAARWASQQRNQAKADIRRWDLDVLRLLAEERNRRMYGDPIGPSYESLTCERSTKSVCVPKSDLEIVSSAGQSNAAVNQVTSALEAGGGLLFIATLAASARERARSFRSSTRGALCALSGVVLGCLLAWLGARLVGGSLAMITGLISPYLAPVFAALGALVGAIAGAISGGEIATRWVRDQEA
ncbi:MAG: hypothetical protein U0165_09425 [Polyangiaceae bacterium]